jgi:hypothetical protein
MEHVTVAWWQADTWYSREQVPDEDYQAGTTRDFLPTKLNAKFSERSSRRIETLRAHHHHNAEEEIAWNAGTF